VQTQQTGGVSAAPSWPFGGPFWVRAGRTLFLFPPKGAQTGYAEGYARYAAWLRGDRERPTTRNMAGLWRTTRDARCEAASLAWLTEAIGKRPEALMADSRAATGWCRREGDIADSGGGCRSCGIPAVGKGIVDAAITNTGRPRLQLTFPAPPQFPETRASAKRLRRTASEERRHRAEPRRAHIQPQRELFPRGGAVVIDSDESPLCTGLGHELLPDSDGGRPLGRNA
jgi:hypothetical protein